MPDPTDVLRLEGIRKRFGTTPVLHDVSLTLRQGEVVALLGASGSGKTTLLRVAGGLERPDAGRVWIGRDLVFDGTQGTDVPAEGRNLGFVFQSYALWPHMTVVENVGYGLRLRRVSTTERAARVERTLVQLGLGGLGARYPHQLSGGQQQRVALARALVYEPPVVLLDEPLSNLDANLREEARSWLRELIVSLRLSALFVTHDQVEALAIADRVVLLNRGVVEQEGSPEALYGAPRTKFVATFLGSSTVLPITHVETRHDRTVTFSVGSHRLAGRLMGEATATNASVAVIRVEGPHLATAKETPVLTKDAVTITVPLRSALYLGERWEYVFDLAGTPLRTWGSVGLAAGEYEVTLPVAEVWVY